MPLSEATIRRLSSIPDARKSHNVSLSAYTRFAIGGPATLFFDTSSEAAFVEALQVTANCSDSHLVIGGGSNLIVSDAGFDGVVLRYKGAEIHRQGTALQAQAGAALQAVVDTSIAHGLRGMQSMTGIPGYLGGAVYGNAGAYGRSIHQVVEEVRFAAKGEVKQFNNAECEFRYRESIFKAHKDWIVLSTLLRFTQDEAEELSREATEIRTVRDAKYPPEMKCAGSIFKNLIVAELPVSVQTLIPPKQIREGKVASAWFLEQTGIKGYRRGDIQVATYHANLIYNDGNGTAADLVCVINECKQRVRNQFGFDLEEEVQYVGFRTIAA